VSLETGLLKQWPKDGPPLAWKAEGLGEGAASVVVANGRAYTLGYQGDDEHLTALDAVSGKKVWAARNGPAIRENPVMRWLTQRAPTVDDDRLYVVTARGDLICLRAADGKELWRKSYPNDFGGRSGPWGYCDRPLVDGERLICAPGGARAAVVALNKKDGAVIWKCETSGNDSPSYSATVVTEAAGIRQYIVFLHGSVVGLRADDGKALWSYDRPANWMGSTYAPLVRGDLVFCASGYGSALALLKVIAEKGSVRAEEVYFRKQAMPAWHDTTVLLGDHVYAGTRSAMACIEWTTGKVLWEDRGAVGGNVSVTCADGHLYLRSQDGKVALIEATPKAHVLKGLLSIPGAGAKPGSTAPVVAGGRLYLRDDDVLFCYDVKEGSTSTGQERDRGAATPSPQPKVEPKGHDVFVPTPQDVVEKMLELARVKREDVVYDLGCGDGRIVVTAARKYGCKAVGYDIDPECVRMSRENVKKHDVGRLVTIEEKDIFTLDLRGADVITLYLLPRTMERLLPQLTKLKPGVRIVAHSAAIPGVRVDRIETYRSKEDDLPHKIYLWTTPLKSAGQEK
jgi:outer membrane protein assembly factor BamB/precorrin-6B methylase 2